MPQFTPEAQKGYEYLKTANPALAAKLGAMFAPASSAPVDASKLGQSSPITVPPPKETPIPDYTKVTFSTPIQNTAAQDAIDAENDQIIGDITATGQKLATKGARKAELETQQNIPALTGQLNEINNIIRGIQSESFAATMKSEDRRAPMFAITGEQAAIERQRASRVYGWAAAAEAIQGNIALANDNVSRALDAEFCGLEQEIENKKFLLQVNMDRFDREEKRAAEQRQVALDREKERLADLRMEREGIYGVMQIASQFGASSDVLNRIMASQTQADAMIAAGTFMQDPKAKYELEGLKLANDLRRAQITTEKAQAAKIRAELIPTGGAPIPSVSDTSTAASGYKSDVVGAITGLKLNESQSNAVSYAFRMIEANSNINNQLGDGKTVKGPYNPTTVGAAIGRVVKSDNARTLERDLENFIRAQLRKESGAQISPEEMAGGRKIYSPQGVLTNQRDVAATKQTREQAIQSMIAQAGPAGKHLKEYYDYMQAGGLSPEDRAIIYSGGATQPSSTKPVISGMKYY